VSEINYNVKICLECSKAESTASSATLLLASRTQAAEVLGAELLAPNRVATTGQTTTSNQRLFNFSSNRPTSASSSSGEITDEVTPAAEIADQDTQAPDAFAQVTSVSQLSDVPTDWAFQALQFS